jgi:hypothetical protein
VSSVCGPFTDVTFGPATRLTHPRQTARDQAFSVGNLQTWLDGDGKSPNEQVMKSRLRELP